MAWAETMGCLFLPGQSLVLLGWVQQASPRELAQAVLVSVQISKGLGCPIPGFWLQHAFILPFVTYASQWHMGMLLVLSCPVLASMVPAVDGHKGLATGGPCAQPLLGEGGCNFSPALQAAAAQALPQPFPVNVSAGK